MLIRIVKMTFRPEKVEDFLKVFTESKQAIRNFEGCKHLQLLQSKENTNVLFTYSFWEDEFCLNAYRKSELFNKTWAKTKILFSAKPEAWSVNQLEVLN